MTGKRGLVSAFTVFLCALFPGVAAAATLFYDVDAGLLRDDNLGRAERSADTEADSGVELFARMGNFIELREGTGLTVSGSLRATHYDSFDDLGETSAGLSVSLKHKYGLGAGAPWVSVGAGSERIASGSDIRDGWLHQLNVGSGKRFGERWNLGAGLRFEQRDGDQDRQQTAAAVPGPGPAGTADGDVFDQQNLELYASADYALTDTLLLLLSYRYRDGDVVSSALPYARIVANARALTADDAFGAGITAYRLEAQTHVAALGLNLALTGNASLDLGYEYQSSDAEGGIEYDKAITRLRVLISF